MRSMALASAPVCSLLLVLKLANCSLLVLLVAENWLHGLRFVWVRATHILNDSDAFHICALAVKLSPTATARRLCLYACLWRALKRALFDEFKRRIPKKTI